MTAALVLLLIQGCLGAFDTLWYHEWRQRLPARATARAELRLHAARDFLYAAVFGTLGWWAWDGWLAWALAALLLAEVALTLWDFLEEDRTRKLPGGERAMHALMGIVYGAFLACLLPHLLAWAQRPTGFAPSDTGAFAWPLTLMAVGVLLSGLRDLAASVALAPEAGEGQSL